MADRNLPTPRVRRRQTSRLVRAIDAVARVGITLGGIGTIVAVSLVFVFLLWVVLPLFLSPALGPPQVRPAPAREKVLHFAVDEYRLLGWTLDQDGTLRVFHLEDGQVLHQQPLDEPAALTAVSVGASQGDCVLAFADGSVRLADLQFVTEFLAAEAAPEEARDLAPGESRVVGDAVVARTPQGQFRSQRFAATLSEPLRVADGPIDRLHHARQKSETSLVVLTRDGRLRYASIKQRENRLTGEVSHRVQTYDLAGPPRDDGPQFVLIGARGESVFAAFADGTLWRFDTRRPRESLLAEEADLLPDSDARLTGLAPLVGRGTLVAGDSEGTVAAWFLVPWKDAATSDGWILVRSHQMTFAQAAVAALAPSGRDRVLAAAYADGAVSLFHMTTGRTLLQAQLPQQSLLALSLAPRDDALLALTAESLWSAPLDLKYAEASFAALFRPMWYEGYPQPQHTWQSSGSGEGFEPKFGLMPLVFGTLKATFYSMLFGAPLALLAAVYTSEFLHPRSRAKIKPAVELMASLPSVVLGFLAANVFAVFVENRLPAVLACFLTLPLTLLLCAYIFQLLPKRLFNPMSAWRFPLVMFVGLPLGIASGAALGPWFERAFFGGDIMHWTNRQACTGTAAWFMLTLPLAALAAAWATTQYFNPWFRQWASAWSHQRFARWNLVRFMVLALATIGLAGLVAQSLTWLGFDPRGSYVGGYDPRNALVVGFVMGFAIIPIIYTLADDALSAVPEHLRAASLGAGATPAQTAIRVVIPTALSGLFSALMVGLGRAVGETMIVLMAAGNTPLMEWNVFNGFRTLSATIATELPEAVRNSTHYRTLFLAALTLFLLTFLVNTLAETVRIRFRRRAYAL